MLLLMSTFSIILLLAGYFIYPDYNVPIFRADDTRRDTNPPSQFPENYKGQACPAATIKENAMNLKSVYQFPIDDTTYYYVPVHIQDCALFIDIYSRPKDMCQGSSLGFLISTVMVSNSSNIQFFQLGINYDSRRVLMVYSNKSLFTIARWDIESNGILSNNSFSSAALPTVPDPYPLANTLTNSFIGSWSMMSVYNNSLMLIVAKSINGPQDTTWTESLSYVFYTLNKGGPIAISSQMNASLYDSCCILSLQEFSDNKYVFSGVVGTPYVSPSTLSSNVKSFLLRSGGFVFEVEVDPLISEPIKRRSLARPTSSEESFLQNIPTDRIFSRYSYTSIEPFLFSSPRGAYNSSETRFYVFYDLSCIPDVDENCNPDTNALSSQVGLIRSPVLYSTKDFKEVSDSDPLWDNSQSLPRSPLFVVEIWPFVYPFVIYRNGEYGNFQTSDQGSGILIDAYYFDPFHINASRVSCPFPINYVSQETSDRMFYENFNFLTYSGVDTFEPQGDSSVTVFFDHSCNDVLLFASFEVSQGPDYNSFYFTPSGHFDRGGSFSSNIDSFGLIIGLIWIFIFFIFFYGNKQLGSIAGLINQHISMEIKPSAKYISSIAKRANITPVALMIIEYLQLSAFVLAPNILWPESLTWYTKSVSPFVLFDMNQLRTIFIVEASVLIAIGMMTAGLSMLLFRSLVFYLNFRTRRLLSRHPNDGLELWKRYASKSKIRSYLLLLVPFISTVGFIPILKISISSSGCIPVFDVHNASEYTFSRVSVDFGNSLCFLSETHWITLFFGLFIFVGFFTFCIKVLPLWQFLEIEQEVYYTPQSVVYVSMIKLLIVVTSVFLFRIPEAMITVQLISSVFLIYYFTRYRPCSIWSITNWRCSFFIASFWSCICGFVAIEAEDPENEISAILFYSGTFLILMSCAIYTYYPHRFQPTSLIDSIKSYPYISLSFVDLEDFSQRIFQLVTWKSVITSPSALTNQGEDYLDKTSVELH